jgi:hypothetical protein
VNHGASSRVSCSASAVEAESLARHAAFPKRIRRSRVSNNTDKPERAIKAVARYASPFNAEAMRSVYEVNQLFLSWLVRSSDLTEFETMIQKPLLEISADALRLAAECPFLLIDAKFQDARAWRNLVDQAGKGDLTHQITSGRYDSSRIGLARSTFFAAWYIVHRWPANAELLIGANQDVVASISQIELTRLAGLAEACTGWIAPRWPDRPDVWNQLLIAATNAPAATSVSLRQRALQLLLGRLLG